VKVYSLGSPFGVVPCEALARNWKCENDRTHNAGFSGDPVAIWGQLRGAKDLVAQSRHFYRLDHAYCRRMDYYRMTRGDFQPFKIVPRPSDRWDVVRKRYELKISPWVEGGHVVVALSDPRTYEYFGRQDFPQWVEAEIRKYTDRKIVMRKREEKRPLSEDLRGAHCLVTYASNSVIESLLAGVPVFPLGPSIARPMGYSDLSRIETPLRPDNRDEFLSHMAYCQFTTVEFETGFATRTADETWATATA
jgi:hypothetical protein